MLGWVVVLGWVERMGRLVQGPRQLVHQHGEEEGDVREEAEATRAAEHKKRLLAYYTRVEQLTWHERARRPLAKGGEPV